LGHNPDSPAESGYVPRRNPVMSRAVMSESYLVMTTLRTADGSRLTADGSDLTKYTPGH
jgi:hypothetical protein